MIRKAFANLFKGRINLEMTIWKNKNFKLRFNEVKLYLIIKELVEKF